MRHIHIQILKWKVWLNPNGYADPIYHYEGYDGRKLSLEGVGKLSPLGSDDTPCDVSVCPSISLEAAKAECVGFARLWPKDDGNPQLFGATIGLPKSLWEELWRWSFAPPKASLLTLRLLGFPEERALESLPEGEEFRVIDPSFGLYPN
jgi:hypothetical protein